MLCSSDSSERWRLHNEPINHLSGDYYAITTDYPASIDNGMPWLAGCRVLFSANELGGRIAVIEDYDASLLSNEQLGAMIRQGMDIAFAHQVFNWTNLLVENLAMCIDEMCTLAAFRREAEIAKRMCNLINGLTPSFTELANSFDKIWNCEHNSGGWIYCLSDQQGHYKIGRTKYLDERIKKLGTLPPFPILTEVAFQVMNAPAYEKGLHESFATSRLRGEWFKLSDVELQTLKDKAGR